MGAVNTACNITKLHVMLTPREIILYGTTYNSKDPNKLQHVQNLAAHLLTSVCSRSHIISMTFNG